MEWALAIPRLQMLSAIKNPWSGPNVSSMYDVKEVLEEQFGRIVFTRFYYGEEFCEKALSGKPDLIRALRASEEAGMKFTYVTPYVTEKGLLKLQDLLGLLAGEKPGTEVVINDWGVLDWLVEHQPTLTPILGRLMNKILRDPRMPKGLANPPDGNVIRHFQTSSLAGPGMQDLLHKYNVRRIELDFPPQGLDPELPEWGYHSSLYLPFGVVTTGRICFIHSWGLKEKDKFKTSGYCDRKCQLCWLEMSDQRYDPFGFSGLVKKSSDWKIIQKGNTVFYRQSQGFLSKALTQVKKSGVDRIIFQPEPL